MLERFRVGFGYLRGFYLTWRHAEQMGWLCQRGSVQALVQRGTLRLGTKVWLWPQVKLDCDAATHVPHAVLTIGVGSSIGDRTQIHCGERVTIGRQVLISWGCTILDRDYHSLNGEGEHTAPITIDDRVWIGCHSIILKGVHIGEGAVIGAGSVVTHDIPARTLAAGNPAKVIRTVQGCV